VLLQVLDEPDQLAVGLDGEGHRAVVWVDQLVLDAVQIEAAPPAGDLGVGEDLGQPRGVVGRRRPKADGMAAQRSGLGRDHGLSFMRAPAGAGRWWRRPGPGR